MTKDAAKVGLVLSGGGARGAYQAGAIKALALLLSEAGIEKPFPYISGTSAGALNAVYTAAYADNIPLHSANLADFWSKLHTDMVFKTDVASLAQIAGRWLKGLLLGGMQKSNNLYALLDTAPLRELLDKQIPFWRIADNLKAGHLDGLEVTATDYASSESISFVQSLEDIEWVRARRRSLKTAIGLDHVLASSAIPIFFPPVQIGQRPYGDGCLRNTAPLSPALHMGATKLLIIGVRMVQESPIAQLSEQVVHPTIARVLSVLLNAVFMDALEFDMERTRRINSALSFIPHSSFDVVDLHKIDLLVLQPSEDLGALAAKMFESLPSSIKYMFKGLGSSHESSELASYLMFEPEYCGYLVDLGFRDTMARSRDILEFYLRADPNRKAS